MFGFIPLVMRYWWIVIVLGFNLVCLGQTDTTTGVASYYAKRFEGRRTASGEKFKHKGLTAAHKSLPFGTWVKVTNVKNDSVVVVRINDRLPKHSKRTIDLTISAAKQLNFMKYGLAKVRLEVLSDSTEVLQVPKVQILSDTLQTK